MSKKGSNNQGVTLIELIVALVIIGLAFAIAYPMFGLLNKTASSQMDEFDQRSDVMIASEYLSQDTHFAKSITCPDARTVEIIDSNSVSVKYRLVGSGADSNLVREKDGKTRTFTEIRDVHFILENPDLLSVSFITASAQNDFKVAKWDNTVAVKDSVIDFIVEKRVFVFTNQLAFNGSTDIYGPDQTVIVNGGYINNGNISIIVKNQYYDGNASFTGNTTLGLTDNTSVTVVRGDFLLSGGSDIYGDVYISGDLIMSGNVYIYGNVYVEGDVVMSGTLRGDGRIEYEGTFRGFDPSQCSKVPEVKTVIFPEYSLPVLRTPEWYQDHGYSSQLTVTDDSKVYTSGDFAFNIPRDVQNVTIVSEGDITINGNIDMSGVLFAPNGTIYFNGKTFTGVVISKGGFFNSVGTLNSKSIQDMIPNPENYPFGGIK